MFAYMNFNCARKMWWACSKLFSRKVTHTSLKRIQFLFVLCMALHAESICVLILDTDPCNKVPPLYWVQGLLENQLRSLQLPPSSCPARNFPPKCVIFLWDFQSVILHTYWSEHRVARSWRFGPSHTGEDWAPHSSEWHLRTRVEKVHLHLYVYF